VAALAAFTEPTKVSDNAVTREDGPTRPLFRLVADERGLIGQSVVVLPVTAGGALDAPLDQTGTPLALGGDRCGSSVTDMGLVESVPG
jgi:hypothetical protein